MKGDGGGEATWIVDAKNGKGKVEFNGKAKPDVTFTTSDADLFDLMRGELNPQKAFFAVSYKTRSYQTTKIGGARGSISG